MSVRSSAAPEPECYINLGYYLALVERGAYQASRGFLLAPQRVIDYLLPGPGCRVRADWARFEWTCFALLCALVLAIGLIAFGLVSTLFPVGDLVWVVAAVLVSLYACAWFSEEEINDWL